MKIGTKSLLFGCHQAVWHPLTILFAYRRLFQKWPDFYGFLAILVHDWGYWGCPNIDGKEGRGHPWRGAYRLQKWIYRIERFRGRSFIDALCKASHQASRCAFHSSTTAREFFQEPSDICWADKYCIFYEPEWFYLFRTWLSGETLEFRENAIKLKQLPPTASNRDWFRWYKSHLLRKPEIQNLLSQTSGDFRNRLLQRNIKSCIIPLPYAQTANDNPVECVLDTIRRN